MGIKASNVKTMNFSQGLSIFCRFIIFVIPSAIINVTRAIFIARSRGLDVKIAIQNAIAKSIVLMGNIPPRELQLLTPPGETAYRRWIASKHPAVSQNIEQGIDVLKDGESKLFWVGSKDRHANIILFFHGGGYVLPLSKGHFEWAEHFCVSAKNAGMQLSVALLDYSLCPPAIYPTPMRQAALALEHLLSLGYSPSQIVVGGDSAGGHMSLSLISHLMYQYPDSTFPSLRLQQPLSGCFLVSPLLSHKLDTPSYTENYHADVLSVSVIRDWGADMFRGSPFHAEEETGKAWGMALVGTDDWWGNLGGSVKNIYLVGGGQELFRDDIIQFGEVLKKIENVDARVHINMEEAHDYTFFDFERGMPPSRSTIRLADWVVEILKRSNGGAGPL